MIDAWYPLQENYYAESELARIPVRQGDLIEPGSICLDSRGRSWHGCIVVHPSCEVVTGKADRVQVCRVRRLQDHRGKYQQMIVRGETTGDDGQPRIAMSHTFFLPPARQSGSFSVPMFADLREVAMLPKAEVTSDHRVAALTHDARVHFIRRSLYWRQRWFVSLNDVRDLEAVRIGSDPNFEGPRPDWASLVA